MHNWQQGMHHIFIVLKIKTKPDTASSCRVFLFHLISVVFSLWFPRVNDTKLRLAATFSKTRPHCVNHNNNDFPPCTPAHLPPLWRRPRQQSGGRPKTLACAPAPRNLYLNTAGELQFLAALLLYLFRCSTLALAPLFGCNAKMSLQLHQARLLRCSEVCVAFCFVTSG